MDVLCYQHTDILRPMDYKILKKSTIKKMLPPPPPPTPHPAGSRSLNVRTQGVQ